VIIIFSLSLSFPIHQHFDGDVRVVLATKLSPAFITVGNKYNEPKHMHVHALTHKSKKETNVEMHLEGNICIENRLSKTNKYNYRVRENIPIHTHPLVLGDK